MESISIEEADNLVLEHKGWAESIARSVARAWNMDWQADGLDGAALEALIFCSRRFDPTRGVPFRGYARKRIHEASTDAARKSRGWRRGTSSSDSDQEARAISSELFNVFPELRAGEIPLPEDGADGEGNFRAAIRQLIVGATIIAAKQGITTSSADDVMDYKRLIRLMATLEPVHQAMMWKIYWEGDSMRTVAEDWKIDELVIIREHKLILGYLSKTMATAKEIVPPRIRPGLKHIAMQLKRTNPNGQFTTVVSQGE